MESTFVNLWELPDAEVTTELCRFVLHLRCALTVSVNSLLHIYFPELSGGRLKDEDILVLPLDLLCWESHTGAAETVMKYFKQVTELTNNRLHVHGISIQSK